MCLSGGPRISGLMSNPGCLKERTYDLMLDEGICRRRGFGRADRRTCVGNANETVNSWVNQGGEIGGNLVLKQKRAGGAGRAGRAVGKISPSSPPSPPSPPIPPILPVAPLPPLLPVSEILTTCLPRV